MFDYKKAMELMNEAKKLGPVHEAVMKSVINAVYGKGYVDTDSFDDASMYTPAMHDDRLPWNLAMKQDLIDDIKCHMMNVYGIKNPKVTINENNEVNIDISFEKGDYWITNVIFNDPATVVFWSDGTKTVVKCCEDDIFDKEKGLAMACVKKLSDNNSERFHKGLRRWIKPVDDTNTKTYYDIIKEGLRNWGTTAREALITLNTNTRKKEYEFICPCCSNKIKIPSKTELLCQGGTRCPICGLEIQFSEEKPLKPGSKEGIELADKILSEMETKRIAEPRQLTPEEEKLCHPENTEK